MQVTAADTDEKPTPYKVPPLPPRKLRTKPDARRKARKKARASRKANRGAYSGQ